MEQTKYGCVENKTWSAYPMGKQVDVLDQSGTLNVMGIHASYCAKAHDHSKRCDCHLQGNYRNVGRGINEETLASVREDCRRERMEETPY